ncbi:MAG TPA: hypothetical protein VFD06_04920, partial [Candidatus Polarisedimenticolia bacterium]|nr:hypothetical protein [Candidatus Polarisedimenticolia bacterium]
MTAPDDHPDLIAWVSGAMRRVGPGAPATMESEVAAHLRGCEACRTEAEELRSMRRSLRASEESHLAIDTLLEMEAAGIAGFSGKDGAAEKHLSRCGACRADLDALVGAGRARLRMEPERTPAPDRAARRRARLAWAAAAAIAVVGLGVL